MSAAKALIKRLLNRILPFLVTHFPFLFRRISAMTPEQAQDLLSQYSPIPRGSALGNNALLAPSCDLQIIVPAYNVEAYLAECMDSILSQKTRDFGCYRVLCAIPDEE